VHLVEALAVGAVEAGVEGLAASEAVFGGVPVGDGGLAELPAEEDGGAVDLAGEVEETGFEILTVTPISSISTRVSLAC
jgi:hypothetical protein